MTPLCAAEARLTLSPFPPATYESDDDWIDSAYSEQVISCNITKGHEGPHLDGVTRLEWPR